MCFNTELNLEMTFAQLSGVSEDVNSERGQDLATLPALRARDGEAASLCVPAPLPPWQDLPRLRPSCNHGSQVPCLCPSGTWPLTEAQEQGRPGAALFTFSLPQPDSPEGPPEAAHSPSFPVLQGPGSLALLLAPPHRPAPRRSSSPHTLVCSPLPAASLEGAPPPPAPHLHTCSQPPTCSPPPPAPSLPPSPLSLNLLPCPSPAPPHLLPTRCQLPTYSLVSAPAPRPPPAPLSLHLLPAPLPLPPTPAPHPNLLPHPSSAPSPCTCSPPAPSPHLLPVPLPACSQPPPAPHRTPAPHLLCRQPWCLQCLG